MFLCIEVLVSARNVRNIREVPKANEVLFFWRGGCDNAHQYIHLRSTHNAARGHTFMSEQNMVTPPPSGSKSLEGHPPRFPWIRRVLSEFLCYSSRAMLHLAGSCAY